jgi:asparagine synthase (glutamine-hydrolysing)
MCGIAGLMRFDQAPVQTGEVEKILKNISHRGRDYCGVWVSSSNAVGLGHRRLSIIDLHEAGSQPMFYAERQLCISYNGEIYNYLELKQYLQKKSYPFTTQSDTEVLLAAYHHWGAECVKHLNGMFAFAIWDDHNKQLFCARDAVGVKPFYYIFNKRYFAFCSESLALAHLAGGELNSRAISTYLLSMYVGTNESIFSGVRKLLPGHTCTLALDGTQTFKRFWSVEQFEGMNSDETTRSSLTATIQAAVKRQLQSDVPVGGFLSGGVDSGLITAMAAPFLKKYHTYSVGYEGMAEASELAHARALSTRFATQHTEVTLSASDSMDILNKALAHISEPIADPAIVATYHLSELAANDGVKVLLNGTGGDEIFGGYTRYSGQLSLKRKFLSKMPVFLKKSLTFLPINPKVRARLQSPALDMLFSAGGSYSLAASIHEQAFLPYLATLAREFSSTLTQKIPLLYQQMLFDLQVYLPEQLLFLLDQMTMAHTIEGRVPLLDVEVIKQGFLFNAKEHMRQGQTKVILKQIAEPFLGSAAVLRKKQGFAGSSGWWVKHNLKEFVAGIAELRNHPYFAKLDIDAYHHLDAPTDAAANDIFILYCFSRWYSRVKSLLANSGNNYDNFS